MKIEVPSRALSRAWQVVQIAAADDPARPLLHRSALVEVFNDHGLRLVATDSFILVRAWVSLDPEGGFLEPPLDEVPDNSFVVSDPDHRGLGLLKYISKLHRKLADDTAVPPVLMTRQREAPDEQGVFEGLEIETLRLAWPHHEEVSMPLVEGEFPEWRHLVNEASVEATETISFTSRTLGALAKLGDLHSGHSIDWMLDGPLGIVRFSIGPLSGLLMPARPAKDNGSGTEDEPR